MSELIEPTVIFRAATCGHHHSDDCTACVRSREMNDNMLDQERAEITRLQALVDQLSGAISTTRQLAAALRSLTEREVSHEG